MSKTKLTLSEERKEEIVSEIVEMYIEKGGLYPTSRDIKKNNLISELEVAAVRKLGLLEEWRIRKLAKEKTGINYPSIGELRRKHTEKKGVAKMTDTKELAKATEVTEANEAPKNLELPEKPETSEATVGIITPKAPKMAVADMLKRVLREFGEANLRWPTDAEIKKFKKDDVPGWRTPSQIRYYFGEKANWEKHIFPEGLPAGFTLTTRGGFHRKKPASLAPEIRTDQVVSSNEGVDKLKERIEWINKLISEGHLDATLEMASDFKMKSELTIRYKDKELTLTFEVK